MIKSYIGSANRTWNCNVFSFGKDSIGILASEPEIEYIHYHEPSGEGDAHYCDVHFHNGTIERYFNPDWIKFEKLS